MEAFKQQERAARRAAKLEEEKKAIADQEAKEAGLEPTPEQIKAIEEQRAKEAEERKEKQRQTRIRNYYRQLVTCSREECAMVYKRCNNNATACKYHVGTFVIRSFKPLYGYWDCCDTSDGNHTMGKNSRRGCSPGWHQDDGYDEVLHKQAEALGLEPDQS